MTVYPRYFVVRKPDDKTWMKYCYVKCKGGIIRYIDEENKIKSWKPDSPPRERIANMYVQNGFWREIKPEELVLML